MHFVTEEGTFVSETGTLKQTSCKWDQSFLLSTAVKSSSFTGFVQVLTTSCQKKHTSSDLSKRRRVGSDTNTLGFVTLRGDTINPCNWLHLKLLKCHELSLCLNVKEGAGGRWQTKKKGHCVRVCMHAYFFLCMCTSMCRWLAGWRVSGQAWINKLCVGPICSPATLITTRVLQGTAVIIGPRYRRSKNTVLLNNSLDSCLFTSRLSWCRFA